MRLLTRQQLPPQIRKVKIVDRKTGKPAVRYQVTVDAGTNPVTGRRHQVRRRYPTERSARQALSEIGNQAARGEFVPRQPMTVDQVCSDYMRGRHNLRATSLTKLGYDLAPLRERHGDLPVQRLTKSQLDTLVTDLLAGGTLTAKGRKRRGWSAVAVNKVISSAAQVLADAQRQGVVNRNVAEMVSRVAVPYTEVDTYNVDEVVRLLASVEGDRLSHVCELALVGLRRGEIAGLRWSDVDLDGRTLAVVNNRVAAGGKVVENEPKSVASRRSLPLADGQVSVLRSAKARQAAERLALGADGGPWEYVVCNEAGMPYHPQSLSRYWAKAVKAAGLRHIKLHGGRHTAATELHLGGAADAVVAAWIGHRDSNLTKSLYLHSQPQALKAAGEIFNRRDVTPS